jgi:hypothetical protein
MVGYAGWFSGHGHAKQGHPTGWVAGNGWQRLALGSLMVDGYAVEAETGEKRKAEKGSDF